jgi:hypothetical protein
LKKKKIILLSLLNKNQLILETKGKGELGNQSNNQLLATGPKNNPPQYPLKENTAKQPN